MHNALGRPTEERVRAGVRRGARSWGGVRVRQGEMGFPINFFLSGPLQACFRGPCEVEDY